MATIEDFETLEYAQLLSQSGMGWGAPLVQANFGGGYGAGVLANQTYGLHRWRIKANFLPDTSVFTAGPDDDPYFTYFFDFFRRHILLGNKPFIIKDTWRNKYYLVAFDRGEIDFNRLAAQFYSNDGIQVVERRHADLAFNADGSLDYDPDAPTIPLEFSMTGEEASLDLTLEWTASTDEGSGVDYYEVEIVLG